MIVLVEERRLKFLNIISYDFILVLISGILDLIITLFRSHFLYAVSSFFQFIVINPSVALGDALGLLFVLQASLLGLFIGGIIIMSITFAINYSRFRTEYEEGIPLSTIISSRIITSSRLSSIANWIRDRVEPYVKASAELFSPTEIGIKYTAYFLISLLIVIPLSVTLSLALISPFPFIILLFPLIFIFYPEQMYKSKAREARDNIQDELPFFIVLITIITASGTTIYEAIKKVVEFPIFKFIKREALLILRDIDFFGKSPLDALEHRAKVTLNRDYSWFLAGYTSVIRSGGDVEAYLFQKAREFLNWLQFRWRFYAERTSFLGELIVILFLIFPMFLIALAFFTNGAIISFLLVIPILFGTILYAITINNRPRYMDNIGLNSIQLLVAFFSLFLVSGLVEIFINKIYYSIGLGLLAFSIVFTIFTYGQVKEINDVENSLPQFLRDITEFRKIGYDIGRAIRALALEKKYRPEFNRVLEEIVKQDAMGIPITRAKVNTRSWLGKFALTTVQMLIESGAVRPDLLEYLTEFTLNFVQSKKEAFSRMRVYQVLGVLTPVLLIVTILISIVIMGSFSIVSIPNALGVPQIPNIITQLILSPLTVIEMFSFIFMTSFTIGLLVTKALYGTVQYMILPAITLVIALLSIHSFNIIEPIILKFFSI
ncbi:MAG: type II secretion system F family protein [Saccharolobus sp.]|nr:type II secretion system F family protein [Saccharolobus sp.]MDT7862224.1 type II secretion system F family protein [Saccharolobus sp.]